MTAIVDQFDTDPYGSRWTLMAAGSTESYAAGQWTLNGHFNHTTQLSGLVQYVKVKIVTIDGSDGGETLLRVDPSSSDECYGVIGRWSGGDSSYLTFADDGGWVADLSEGDDVPLVDGDTLAVTVTGTSTGTVVRVWRNPTNNTPAAVDGWDNAGDTADITYSASGGWDYYADTGTYVGLGNQSSDNVFDDFYAGDIAAGGSSSVPGSTFKGMFLGTNRGMQRHQ